MDWTILKDIFSQIYSLGYIEIHIFLNIFSKTNLLIRQDQEMEQRHPACSPRLLSCICPESVAKIVDNLSYLIFRLFLTFYFEISIGQHEVPRIVQRGYVYLHQVPPVVTSYLNSRKTRKLALI